MKDFEWILEKKSPTKEDDIYSLNRDYNNAIRKARGELIISWQDCTWAPANTIERFWFHYTQNPQGIVSAVGNKYDNDSWIVETWHDPRQKGVSFWECPFHYIEWNLCSIPKQALNDVGGFDEWLDKYYGMDGYSVVDRLDMIGLYKFYLDETIQSYSIEHERPKDWDTMNAIGEIYNKRREQYFENPQLIYLQ